MSSFPPLHPRPLPCTTRVDPGKLDERIVCAFFGNPSLFLAWSLVPFPPLPLKRPMVDASLEGTVLLFAEILKTDDYFYFLFLIAVCSPP